MSWNYRVIKTYDKDWDEYSYAIHEVYYDENLNIDSYTTNPILESEDNLQGLKDTLERMMKTVDRAIESETGKDMCDVLSIENLPGWEPRDQ